jgi:hypothetical protein
MRSVARKGSSRPATSGAAIRSSSSPWSPPSSVSGGRAPDDIVDQNQPLVTLPVEQYAIVADPLADLGGMVSQWPDVSLSRVERKLI